MARRLLRLVGIAGLLVTLVVAGARAAAGMLAGGDVLVYQAQHENSRALYAYDVDRAIEYAVVRSSSQRFFPSWSHDGRRLAYVEQPPAAATADTLYVLDLQSPRRVPIQAHPGPWMAIGTAPLWNGGADSLLFTYVAQSEVSADAAHLVLLPLADAGNVGFRSRRMPELGTQGTAIGWPQEDRARIVTVDRSAVRLTELDLNDFSILYEQIWLVNFVQHWEPIFSPDGRHFIVSAAQPGAPTFDLYRFTVGSDDVINLSGRPTSNETQAVYSPDGRLIAYKQLGDGDQYVVVMGEDGADPRIIFHAASQRISDLRWSPDGQRIAFVMSLPNDYVLCTVEIDTERTVCPIHAERIDEPVWRPRSVD